MYTHCRDTASTCIYIVVIEYLRVASFLCANFLCSFFVLKIIELPNNRVFSSGIGHKKAVRHIQFTADGKTLISSSEDSVIQVVDEYELTLYCWREEQQNTSVLKLGHLKTVFWSTFQLYACALQSPFMYLSWLAIDICMYKHIFAIFM